MTEQASHFLAEANSHCEAAEDCIAPYADETQRMGSTVPKEQGPTAEGTDEGEIELASGRIIEGERIADLKLIVAKASSIKPERLEWLWPERIPAGSITLLAGKPDCGKSMALLDIVARVTTARDWPDGAKSTFGQPRSVLLAASEDDWAKTTVPRLIAAGADLDRVLFIKWALRDERENKSSTASKKLKKKKVRKPTFQLTDDNIRLLRSGLVKHPEVALVAFDPLTAYTAGKDANSDKEIRPLLEGVGDCASLTKAAFVAVIHHNKRSDVDALQKILGASSVAGLCRAAWGFSRDPDNKEEYYMARVKNNLSKERSGLKYKIVDVPITLEGKSVALPRTEWLGRAEEDANEVLDKERDTKGRKELKAVDKAKLMLLSLLGDGKPHRSEEVFAAGAAEGICKDALYKAKDAAGVRCEKSGSSWWWRIENPHKDKDLLKRTKPPGVKGLEEQEMTLDPEEVM